MSMNHVCVVLLVLAVLLGAARHLLSLWRSEASQRPKLWRVSALLSLQVVSAVWLYFSLFPPPTFTSAERLVILTAHADIANAKISGRVLALPEAVSSTNSEHVPDLATALRRYPGVHHLQIIGDGLSPRDQDAARGLSIEFKPSPLPSGLVELSLPEKISSGARWSLQGRVHQIEKARVELLDPGNSVVASTLVNDDGNFLLADTARTAGFAMYKLRILDDQKKILDTVKLPLNIVQEKPLRVLSLSGGPNAELKYLRRWALDAGVELQSQVNLSVGVQMNNAAIAINAVSLHDLDLLILDERAWASMNSANKQSVIDALRGGMGVLLRITGPISANNRRELSALGFAVNDANIVQGIHLDSDGDKKLRPTLTRRPLMVSSRDGVTLLRDDTNSPLAMWRAEARGRIGLIWLTDSYKLVLNGDISRHGQIWQDALSTLARTRNESAVYLLDRNARINERMQMCNIAAKTYVQEPEAGISYLVLDTASGSKKCAAYWPQHSGWHIATTDTQELPFYVRDANETPGIKANAIREATLLLAAKHLSGKNTSRIPVPGSPWPWFSGWLLFTALLWLLERSKLGV
ncbi:MAG: hypothetical protein ABI644_13110 [Arenimonas sp.]